MPLLLSIDGTDGRTPDRYIDPATHTMRAASVSRTASDSYDEVDKAHADLCADALERANATTGYALVGGLRLWTWTRASVGGGDTREAVASADVAVAGRGGGGAAVDATRRGIEWPRRSGAHLSSRCCQSRSVTTQIRRAPVPLPNKLLQYW